jgi:hypothetical protein
VIAERPPPADAQQKGVVAAASAEIEVVLEGHLNHIGDRICELARQFGTAVCVGCIQRHQETRGGRYRERNSEAARRRRRGSSMLSL